MRFRTIRRCIWPLLLLASASIPAQLAAPPTWIEFASGENVSFSEATWELFVKVAEGNDPDYLAELSVQLQLNDKQLRELTALMKRAVKDSDAHSTSLRKGMCSNRARFTTPDVLSRELERIDEETLDQRDKLMVPLGPLLGLGGMTKLEPVVLALRGGLRIPRINYLEAMRAMKETPAAVLTRMCAEFK